MKTLTDVKVDFEMISFRKPQLKVWLFTFIFGASAVITAYVTYVNKFEPIAIFSPE
jgi:hypothetical protein